MAEFHQTEVQGRNRFPIGDETRTSEVERRLTGLTGMFHNHRLARFVPPRYDVADLHNTAKFTRTVRRPTSLCHQGLISGYLSSERAGANRSGC
jgi:hypothetical protein